MKRIEVERMSGLTGVWDVTRLRLLVELERSASLSQAAKLVGISQPSASEHLRMLTVAAGEDLAERKGRGLQLTPAGRILARYAAQTLANLSAAESTLAARAGLRTGTLLLGASSVPGTYIVPEILSIFTTRCPEVDVRVSVGSTTEVLGWLLSGRISMAVTCSENSSEFTVTTPVGHDEIVGVARPGSIAISSTGIVRPDQLDRARLFVQELGASTRDTAIELLHGTGYHWGSVWELGSIDAVKRAARAGPGVGFVSIHAISDERRRGELVEFRVEDLVGKTRHVNVARLVGSAASPADRYFESLLVDGLAR